MIGMNKIMEKRIYLDYSANTPVDQEVLDCFIEESQKYIGNPNSTHSLGREAKERMEYWTEKAAGLLDVLPSEIIFTSGASESNNLAIKGIAEVSKQRGKHIISTCLEHASVSGALTFLQKKGYEIDLVDLDENGQVDLEHLEELLRDDTILVSIGYVDSELGIVQPVEEIGKMLKSFPNCHFHVDATQAIGKIPVNFSTVDCVSIAAHKFYGLNGCGILIKKEGVVVEPMIHGGSSSTLYRSGTPALSLSASVVKALELAITKLEDNQKRVQLLRNRMEEEFQKYPDIRINSTKKCIPHIFNLSIKGMKSTKTQEELDKLGVCISTKSACSVANTPSRPVYAVTKDKKNALSSFRISISHKTTDEELESSFEIFKKVYENSKALNNQGIK